VSALLAATVLGFACAAPPVERTGAEGFDLVGTWYVQVLHREETAGGSESIVGEDAVWRFERRHGRLHWMLFATPSFDDDERVESFGTAPPTAAQVALRTRGLAVTRRNAFEKILEGSDASGWSSGEGARPTSASVLTLARRLRIDGLPERPVFTRVETFGGVGAEELAGTTRYAAREVESDRLVGDCERDGERVGGFAMWRIGSVRVRE